MPIREFFHLVQIVDEFEKTDTYGGSCRRRSSCPRAGRISTSAGRRFGDRARLRAGAHGAEPGLGGRPELPAAEIPRPARPASALNWPGSWTARTSRRLMVAHEGEAAFGWLTPYLLAAAEGAGGAVPSLTFFTHPKDTFGQLEFQAMSATPSMAILTCRPGWRGAYLARRASPWHRAEPPISPQSSPTSTGPCLYTRSMDAPLLPRGGRPGSAQRLRHGRDRDRGGARPTHVGRQPVGKRPGRARRVAACHDLQGG